MHGRPVKNTSTARKVGKQYVYCMEGQLQQQHLRSESGTKDGNGANKALFYRFPVNTVIDNVCIDPLVPVFLLYTW